MKNQVKLSSLRAHNPAAYPGLNGDSLVLRKQMTTQVAIQPNEERVCIVKISTIDVDKDNEVILPMGIIHREFDLNPVVLWSHQHGQPPVGSVIALEATEKALFAKIKMSSSALGMELWTLIKEGHLRACSIGFIGLSAVEPGDDLFLKVCLKYNIPTSVSRIFTSVELVENSWCSIPSNAAALIQAISSKTITISPELEKQFHLEKVADAVAVVEPVVAAEVAKIVEPAAVVTPAVEPTTAVVEPVAKIAEVDPVVVETPVAVVMVQTEDVAQPIWRVVRVGDLVLDEAGKALASDLASGKVI